MSDPNFLVLFESVSRPITRQNISCTFSNTKYKVPDYLKKEIISRTESIKRRSQEEGFEFFDDVVARLDNWHLNHDDSETKLSLHFSETTYYYFATMNLGLNNAVTTNNDIRRYSYKDKYPTLRDLLNEESNELWNSKLPNPLSVNMSVILKSTSSYDSEDGSNLKPKIVLSKRSKSRTLEARSGLSCLVAGTISIGQGDIDPLGNPDPFRTVIREAKEELSLGLDGSNSNTVFFGLGRNQSNMKPELYGEVVIRGLAENELRAAWENAKDNVESEELIFEYFDNPTLEAIVKERDWSPVGRTATIASIRNMSTS